jgi:hypothetical protein
LNPILLGRDFWESKTLYPLSIPWRNSLEVSTGGVRDRFRSYIDNSLGGLRRVSINLPTTVASFASYTELASKTPEEVVREVYRKTHGTAHDMQLLLDRNGMWNSSTRDLLHKLRYEYTICQSQGDPEFSTKYGLKLSPDFNVEVSLDIVYIDVEHLNAGPAHFAELGSTTTRQLMFLQIMCDRIWFPEVAHTSNRCLGHLLELLDIHWIHRHGHMEMLAFDQEFDKPEMLVLLAGHGINPKIVPLGRHNKLRVERKNITMKLCLRKVRQAHGDKSISWSLVYACFLSNVFYGSKSVSPFELGKGYTPPPCFGCCG